ncbi:19889_t:CDS:2 [Funneliformis geosporum]|uniref:19889_t:CDS:1 n=1 Tax=Funneliformis geosporum TaxID=1117311 RepID=A0A9W4SSV3_9GLOM|nr:19889_t:CDS:2 [Funneliformis geosporum]
MENTLPVKVRRDVKRQEDERLLCFYDIFSKQGDTSKFQCSHKASSYAMCGAEGYYSKEAVKEFIKKVIPLMQKGENWALGRIPVELLSKISYLNGGGGSRKTTRAIQIFKDINIVVFTHTNALAKDFQNDQQKCQIICCGDDAQPPPFFGEMPHDWLKKLKDGHKQNYLIPIPSSSEKKELVKNDIIHLPLNTLPDKFLKDMLADKKVIDWELGYAMTIHTSQGMTLKAPHQLIRVKTSPLSSEIAQEIEKAKKKRWLKYELRPSIQEKLIGYMGQDKEKGCEFDLTVDYILMLKHLHEDKYVLCLIEMKFE